MKAERLRSYVKAERLRWLAAELLIVVLGVMTALAVDEWREGRSDRVLERVYLSRILAEVRADSVNLARIEEGLDEKELALAAVQRWLSGESTSATDTTRLGLSTSFGWAVPNQPPAAYTEMELTGTLILVRNEELRAQIVSYYQAWDHSLFRTTERRSAYPGLLYQVVPPGERYIRAADAARFLAQLPRDELSRAVTHEMNYSSFLREGFVQDLRPRVQSLLTELEDELSRR